MYLGLDLGTSALKALVSDNTGNIIAEASEEYNVYYVANNGTEQNPLDWINALDKILKKLKPFLSNIEGLAISGQMHGLVILDKEDNVIRPCILWNDGRTIKENNELNKYKEEIYACCSNISYAGFTLPKILWLYNNERTNFAKIAKIMLPKDYLIYYLTGEFVSDYTDMAGSLLLDVKNRCYSQKMLNIAKIKEEQLPKLKESYDVVGKVLDNICQKYNLNNNCLVITGGADNALAALGTNTISEGTCNISLGTSGTILMPVKKVPKLNSYGVHIFSHITGSYVMGCILSAANCRKWWLKNIIADEDYSLDEKQMLESDTTNLYFLPYLQGERSPHNDPLAKGAFIGLTNTTTKGAMSKAILEGVAFALRDSLEIVKESNIKINTLTLCGGGAKSKLWCQIIADVMNLEVKTLANEQGPSFGAILLVMLGLKKITFSDLNKFIKYDKVYYPNNNYEQKYQKYKKIYPKLKEIFKD